MRYAARCGVYISCIVWKESQFPPAELYCFQLKTLTAHSANESIRSAVFIASIPVFIGSKAAAAKAGDMTQLQMQVKCNEV